MSDQNKQEQEFDQAFERQWTRSYEMSSKPDSVLQEERPIAHAWAKWAWQLQAERRKPLLACSTCDGTPHASGLVCVCGGTNSSLAERDGLRRECHDLEQKVALLEKEIEEAINDRCQHCKGGEEPVREYVKVFDGFQWRWFHPTTESTTGRWNCSASAIRETRYQRQLQQRGASE